MDFYAFVDVMFFSIPPSPKRPNTKGRSFSASPPLALALRVQFIMMTASGEDTASMLKCNLLPQRPCLTDRIRLRFSRSSGRQTAV